MRVREDGERGISAVLTAADDAANAILDLAAVLEGLVADSFEVIVLTATRQQADWLSDELRVRAPTVALNLLPSRSVAEAIDAANYELIFVAAPDGQFDVRELNRLLDAIENGADVAAGYRPHRGDGIVRRLERWGINLNVDCAFELFRRRVWREITDRDRRLSCAALMHRLRRIGYVVVEVPVSQGRPAIGVSVSAATRAA